MPDTEFLTNMPRLPASPEPVIYRTSPVPGDVVEMSSLLGEACARWPTTATVPPSDGDMALLSDYSTICHVVARPDRVDEDMQTVGLMGVTAGVVLVLTAYFAWRTLAFLVGLVWTVIGYYRRSGNTDAESRRKADAGALMQWSAQTAVSRLRTVETLKRSDSEVGRAASLPEES